jgi:hypothetical protein
MSSYQPFYQEAHMGDKSPKNREKKKPKQKKK